MEGSSTKLESAETAGNVEVCSSSFNSLSLLEIAGECLSLGGTGGGDCLLLACLDFCCCVDDDEIGFSFNVVSANAFVRLFTSGKGFSAAGARIVGSFRGIELTCVGLGVVVGKGICENA